MRTSADFIKLFLKIPRDDEKNRTAEGLDAHYVAHVANGDLYELPVAPVCGGQEEEVERAEQQRREF